MKRKWIFLLIALTLLLSSCSKTKAAEVSPCGVEIPTFEEALADQPESKADYESIKERELKDIEDPFGKYYAISIDHTKPDNSDDSTVEIALWDIMYHSSDEELRSDDFEMLTTKLASINKATVYGKTVDGGLSTIYVYVTDIEY